MQENEGILQMQRRMELETKNVRAIPSKTEDAGSVTPECREKVEQGLQTQRTWQLHPENAQNSGAGLPVQQ